MRGTRWWGPVLASGVLLIAFPVGAQVGGPGKKAPPAKSGGSAESEAVEALLQQIAAALALEAALQQELSALAASRPQAPAPNASAAQVRAYQDRLAHWMRDVERVRGQIQQLMRQIDELQRRLDQLRAKLRRQKKADTRLNPARSKLVSSRRWIRIAQAAVKRVKSNPEAIDAVPLPKVKSRQSKPKTRKPSGRRAPPKKSPPPRR